MSDENRIYTRTGDSGTTGLFGGGRVRKDSTRVDAYGEVDELNACVGVALSSTEDEWMCTRLSRVQNDLFAIGAHLATPVTSEDRPRPSLPALPDDRIAEFEQWMDEASAQLAPLRSFILPGGTPAAALLHHARTVCRRAERRVVALAASDDVTPGIIVYLNRLSDFLFVAARFANARAGVTDTPWTT